MKNIDKLNAAILLKSAEAKDITRSIGKSLEPVMQYLYDNPTALTALQLGLGGAATGAAAGAGSALFADEEDRASTMKRRSIKGALLGLLLGGGAGAGMSMGVKNLVGTPSEALDKWGDSIGQEFTQGFKDKAEELRRQGGGEPSAGTTSTSEPFTVNLRFTGTTSTSEPFTGTTSTSEPSAGGERPITKDTVLRVGDTVTREDMIRAGIDID